MARRRLCLLVTRFGVYRFSMRSLFGIILTAALSLVVGARALASDLSPSNGAAGNATNGPCVDVQVGHERVPDYDCINRQFRVQAEHAHATAPTPVAPIDTHSSSIQLGTANQAAAQQMMGYAFGKSAQPQRPPPPAFMPALPRAGAH
jgi:hypothetical protein